MARVSLRGAARSARSRECDQVVVNPRTAVRAASCRRWPLEYDQVDVNPRRRQGGFPTFFLPPRTNSLPAKVNVVM